MAFSCKGRGVCPSCNGRRMAQTAADLVDRVIPPVPERQWVISVQKRLRCFLADRPNAAAALTRIFSEEIEWLLCTAAGLTRDGDRPCPARPRLGALSFLHRFGSALNHHVHLHACATDGVFVPTGEGLGRSPRRIWPRSPRSCAVVSCGGSACSGTSTPMRPPTCSLERTVVFRWTQASGSRSSVSNCVSIVSLLSTCCDTVPGRRSTGIGITGCSRRITLWPGWGRSFLSRARGMVATSDSSHSLPIRGRSGRS